MAERRERILVTGGAGFIGSHLVDLLLERPGAEVVVLDKLTYAGTGLNVAHHEPNPRFRFVLGDVADPDAVAPLVGEADRVIHAAAESFVDRSIEDSRAFVLSNVLGTQVVLEACRELETPMLFVSTDEVYGSNRREWLYVRDFVRAIEAVMDNGEPGTVYNIGGGTELTNLDLAKRVCAFLGADGSLISFVEDRPGHDLAYGVRWDRLEALGWRPATPFTDGLVTTLNWYRDHQDWVGEILAGARA